MADSTKTKEHSEKEQHVHPMYLSDTYLFAYIFFLHFVPLFLQLFPMIDDAHTISIDQLLDEVVGRVMPRLMHSAVYTACYSTAVSMK